MNRKLINTSKYIITVVLFFTLVFSVHVAHASESFEEVITSNTIYDSTTGFKIGDTQSFYIPENVVVTRIKLITKTEYPVDSFNDMQLYIKNTINGSMSETVAVTNNTKNIQSYFSDTNFNFSVGLAEGTYWLDTAGSEFISLYSEQSSVDTYPNGGINALEGDEDLYFMVYGYRTSDENSTVIQKEAVPITEQIFGTDQIIRFLAGFIIIFAGITFTKQNIKNDYIVVSVAMAVSIVVYMIGLFNFYYAGLFFVGDLILMFLIRGETAK